MYTPISVNVEQIISEVCKFVYCTSFCLCAVELVADGRIHKSGLFRIEYIELCSKLSDSNWGQTKSL